MPPRVQIVPDAPFVSDLVASCGTGNETGLTCLVLRWSAHEGQLGKNYLWQLQEAQGETLDDVDPASFQTIAWTREPFYLAPVAQRAAHHFRLCARADGSHEALSTWSEQLHVNASAPPQPPPPTLAFRNTTHLGLRWNREWTSVDAGMPALLCELQTCALAASGAEGPWRTAYGGNGDGAMLHVGQPGTALRARLRCANLLGPSAWSDARAFATTPALPAAPGAPLLLKQSSRNVSLGWAQPDEIGGVPLSGYVIERQNLTAPFALVACPPAANGTNGATQSQRRNASTPIADADATGNTSAWVEAWSGPAGAPHMLHTLGGLTPGVSYALRVRARNEAGLSSAGPPLTVRMPLEGGGSAATVEWPSPPVPPAAGS